MKFEVWEYPVGVHNYDSIEIEGAELIESFHFSVDFYGDSDDDGFYICDICDGNSDNVGNYVDFHEKLSIDNEYDISSPNHKYQFVIACNCQWCNTLYIKCPKCNSVTILDDDNKNIECEGGCGLTFYKDSVYDPDDIGDFTIKLIDHRKEKCQSCGSDFIDKNKIGICEKCDLKLNLE